MAQSQRKGNPRDKRDRTLFRAGVELQSVGEQKLLSDSDTSSTSEQFVKTDAGKGNPGFQSQAKRMFSVAKPEWKLLLIASSALVLSSTSNLYIPFATGSIVDAAANSKSPEEGKRKLATALLTLAGVFMIGACFTVVRSTCFSIAGERVSARMRRMLFSSLMLQEIAFFDAVRTGELVNRLSSDCTMLQSAVTSNVSAALRSSVQIIGSLIILFAMSWKLTAVMVSVVPVMVVVTRKYGRFVKALSKRVQAALAEATSVAEEALGNVRTVRSFNKEGHELSLYSDRVQASFLLAKKRSIAFGLFAGFGYMAANSGLLLVLWLGGTQVIEGTISVGSLFSFVLYTVWLAGAFSGLTSVYNDLMKALGATERVFELMDRVPTLVCVGDQRLSDLRGLVELTDVHFSYPTRQNTPVLRGVSMRLEPGTVTALVGESGGGKSTVCALVQRFFDPDVGEITLDGVPLPQLDVSWLRTITATVMQEPVLFATTIRENLMYSCPADVSEDVLVAACEKANAMSFVSKLPEGLDTGVGERGVRLSGGQKQRIAIARAVLRNPAVLLLDEATSALDAQSEALVQEALDVLMVGRTTVLVAHRLSTVKNADNIVMIKGGRIVEQGTHRTLMEKGGAYMSLVHKQVQTQETSSTPMTSTREM